MSFSKTQTFNEIHQILITKNQGVRVNYIPVIVKNLERNVTLKMGMRPILNISAIGLRQLY